MKSRNEERRGERVGRDEHHPHRVEEDYERGYWANDYERDSVGDGQSDDGRADPGRDSSRTHRHQGS